MATAKESPAVALAMGDPCGIGPKLTAKLLADEAAHDAARHVVVGDGDVLAPGEQHASVNLDMPVIFTEDGALFTEAEALASSGRAFWDFGDLDPAEASPGTVTLSAGKVSLQTFQAATSLSQRGLVDTVCLTPFNKAALRLAHPSCEDESVFLTVELSYEGQAGELDTLNGLRNDRVTTHVPLRAVGDHNSRDINHETRR